jgi:hypothetical protein
MVLVYLVNVNKRTQQAHRANSRAETMTKLNTLNHDEKQEGQARDEQARSEYAPDTVYRGGSRWPTLEEIKEVNKAISERHLAAYRAMCAKQAAWD